MGSQGEAAQCGSDPKMVGAGVSDIWLRSSQKSGHASQPEKLVAEQCASTCFNGKKGGTGTPELPSTTCSPGNIGRLPTLVRCPMFGTGCVAAQPGLTHPSSASIAPKSRMIGLEEQQRLKIRRVVNTTS